jgi:O-antigen/teichoic acid export membrane protein
MDRLDSPTAGLDIPQAARHFGWLLAERIARGLIFFAIGLVVARHLGPTLLGTLSFSLAIVTLLAGWVNFGLEGVLSRDVLRQPDRAAEQIASAAVLRLMVGGVAWFALLAVALGLPEGHGAEARLLLVLSPLVLLPSLLLPDVWLRAKLRGRVSASAQLVALSVGALLRLLFVLADAPLTAFAAAAVVEAVVAAWLVHALARREGLHAPWSLARRATIEKLLRECWPLALSGVAVVLYMKIDELMLRALLGPTEVGWYTAATRFTEIWFFLPSAIASSLLPRLMEAQRAGEEHYRQRLQRSYDLQAAAAYTIAIPLALTAPWLVPLAYGPAFAPSTPIVAVHIWSVVFVFLGVARGQWLVQEGHGIFYLVSTLSGALLNIGLNVVMIPRWGGLGAAVATVISYAAAAWLSSYFHPPSRRTANQLTLALALPFRLRAAFRSP